MQVRWFRAVAMVAITLAVSLTSAAQGDLAAIQQKLQEGIIPASLDANGEIVTAGSVITLQKGSLQMCATSAPAGAGAPANTYKNGKLSAGMFSWRLGLGISNIDPNSIPMRTYVAGEKFWVVRVNVTKNGIELKLWTDADSNNLRYWSWLEFPFQKNQIPTVDEVMNTIAEVLAVDNLAVQQPTAAPLSTATTSVQNGPPPPIAGEYSLPTGSRLVLLPNSTFTKFVAGGQGQGQYSVNGDDLTLTFASTGFAQHFKIQGGNLLDVNTDQQWARTENAPAAPPTPLPDIAPPLPPADAPPPTIALGQTMDQVTTAFGQPIKVAKVGTKVIYYYKDMKVSFTNGKVTDVE